MKKPIKTKLNLYSKKFTKRRNKRRNKRRRTSKKRTPGKRTFRKRTSKKITSKKRRISKTKKNLKGGQIYTSIVEFKEKTRYDDESCRVMRIIKTKPGDKPVLAAPSRKLIFLTDNTQILLNDKLSNDHILLKIGYSKKDIDELKEEVKRKEKHLQLTILEDCGNMKPDGEIQVATWDNLLNMLDKVYELSDKFDKFNKHAFTTWQSDTYDWKQEIKNNNDAWNDTAVVRKRGDELTESSSVKLRDFFKGDILETEFTDSPTVGKLRDFMYRVEGVTPLYTGDGKTSEGLKEYIMVNPEDNKVGSPPPPNFSTDNLPHLITYNPGNWD